MSKIKNKVSADKMITVDITYQDTTPESVRAGGCADHGFIAQSKLISIKRLVETINHCEPSSYPIITANLNKNLWFITIYGETIDYQTGRKRYKHYHFNGDDINDWREVIELSNHNIKE